MLGGVKHLYLVPGAALRSLPFEVIRNLSPLPEDQGFIRN